MQHNHEWTSGLDELQQLYYDQAFLEKESIHSSNVNLLNVIWVPFYTATFQTLHPQQQTHNYCT